MQRHREELQDACSGPRGWIVLARSLIMMLSLSQESPNMISFIIHKTPHIDAEMKENI